MGRLIDADKLLKETRKDRDYAEKNGFLDMYYERQVLIDRIKAQPTAYSVDKVVEDVRCRCYEMGLDESQSEIIVREIVKQDGVYEAEQKLKE